MLMAQQPTEPLVRPPQRFLDALSSHRHPQRQRVDEESQSPLDSLSSVQPPKQHRPKDDLFSSRQPGEHLRPRKMTQTRRTDSRGARTRPQPPRQRLIEPLPGFGDPAATASYV